MENLEKIAEGNNPKRISLDDFNSNKVTSKNEGGVFYMTLGVMLGFVGYFCYILFKYYLRVKC